MKSHRRFFIPAGSIAGSELTLEGTDVHHIRRVLRLRPGAELEVVDTDGGRFLVELTAVEDDRVVARVKAKLGEFSPKPEIVLFQGLPKGAKMDEVVRGAVEVGADGIVPVVTDRTVPEIDVDKARRRLERWRRISGEASKQARRDRIVGVSDFSTLASVASKAPSFDAFLIFWEEERNALPSDFLTSETRSVGIMIGPEGGLTPNEVESLAAAGGLAVTMGESVLRTETAGIVATAIVRYELMKLEREGVGG